MAMPRSLLLEELTSPEIQEALEDGFITCLIVSGSIEQHGPHLPLLTDTALGQELALRAAQRLGKTLVAPVIRPGCSEHHMEFPGTITIPENVLIALIEAYCHSLVQHGFKRLVLLSSHGGNFPAVGRAAARLQEQLSDQAKVVAVADLWEFMEAQNRPLIPFNIAPERAGLHAGLAETSEMMVVRPDLVLKDKLTSGFLGYPRDELFERGLKHYIENGILGDARGSKAEYGEAVLNGLADYLASEIRKALDG